MTYFGIICWMIGGAWPIPNAVRAAVACDRLTYLLHASINHCRHTTAAIPENGTERRFGMKALFVEGVAKRRRDHAFHATVRQAMVSGGSGSVHGCPLQKVAIAFNT
jgi:hypothetical protein